MTRSWWDNPHGPVALADEVPILMPGGRRAAIEALKSRIAGFVPEWRDLTEADAGFALVRLFGLQLEPILQRVERLPEKAFVEFLRAAGLTLSAARSAEVILVFTPDKRNEEPIAIPPGTKLLSARADGEKGDVTWETDAGLTVANLELAERLAFDGEIALAAAEGVAFYPLGVRPMPGAALHLGFTGSGRVGGPLSLAFAPLNDGPPAPVAEGGAPPSPTPAVQLRWEALTDRGFQPVDVISDTTDRLTRTGIVTILLPSNLSIGRPAILNDGEDLYWLRLRLAAGRLLPVPRIQAIHLHAVSATAKETFRDEFPVPETDGQTVKVKLSHAPVLTESVVLEIDEGAGSADLFELEEPGASGTTGGTFRRWQQVMTLSGQRADARVFVLDAASGELRFGDGREGRAPPPGIRGIAVRSYATTLGAAGNVAADEITRQTVRIAGISAVTNPYVASGGTPAEAARSAMANGPARLKARGRAVSTGDMAQHARSARGANILKAYALSGVDPAFPGTVRPGTVGVFVVPHRHPSEPTDTPPVASSQTLDAVARHLAHGVGPLGARIVVASPRYEQVRIEATLTVAAGGDPTEVVTAVREALDTWLNPEVADWRIGGTLRHADLTHVVLEAHESVTSVPYLAVTLDGIGFKACADVSLRPFSLPWPTRHRLVAETEEVNP